MPDNAVRSNGGRSDLERRYDQLQAIWRLELSMHVPDWWKLWEVHERICECEADSGL